MPWNQPYVRIRIPPKRNPDLDQKKTGSDYRINPESVSPYVRVRLFKKENKRRKKENFYVQVGGGGRLPIQWIGGRMYAITNLLLIYKTEQKNPVPQKKGLEFVYYQEYSHIRSDGAHAK